MINLEKESEEYARKMWGEYFDNTYDESCSMLSYGEVCQKDFKAGIEFAQKWILVSEELPEKKNHGFSDFVLAKDKMGNVQIERYDFEYSRFNAKRYDIKEDGDGQVTEWRYIDLSLHIS